MKRRDLLMAGTLAGVGVAAIAARPRWRLAEDAGPDIEPLIPPAVGPWSARPAEQVVLPPDANMGAGLYDTIAARQYAAPGRATVTLLAAFSAVQTYASQLHRPELCYPASGFTLLEERGQIFDTPTGIVPARYIRARRGSREDGVLYWIRIGREYPQNLWEQRRMIVRSAFTANDGGGGILMRLSCRSSVLSGAAATLIGFARQLHTAFEKDARILFFGSSSLSGAG